MDNPVEEVSDVIHRLTQAPTAQQLETIEHYFTPNATFTHPFCRTGTASSTKQLICYIYRWYKILSPEIELTVNSVAFDEQNLILYVGISQIFRIFFVPYYKAPVSLVTVLRLVRCEGKYYIASQDDLYQTDEFIKFVAPWGGAFAVQVFQLVATLFCVLGVVFLWPLIPLYGRFWRPKEVKRIEGKGKGKEKEKEPEVGGRTGNGSEKDPRRILPHKRSVSFEDEEAKADNMVALKYGIK